MRSVRNVVAAALLALVAGAGGGCMELKAYERGETIPYAEVSKARDDLGGLIEAELGKGKPDRAFYALELARTRRFAADFITKRDEVRVPTDAVKHLGDNDYLAAVAAAKTAGQPAPSKEEWGAPFFGRDGLEVASTRALPPMREEAPGAQAAAAHVRKLADEQDERFWEELKLLENRMTAYQLKPRQPGMSYGELFRDRIVVTTTLDARLTLAPGEALVDYYVGKDRADAFVVTSDGAKHVPLQGGAASLGADVQALRETVTSGAAGWRAPAKRLHDAIFAPVEAVLAKAKPRVSALLLVAPGPLANLPFAVLASGDGAGSLLVERYRIAYEPSFSVYKAILSREAPKAPPRLLAVGNTSLALAPKEARTMGRIFEGSATWIGPREASESRFYREVKGFNILHLATHGLLVKSQPVLSHVLLGPDAKEDGFLTGVEVACQLDLSHLYVAVLSACQTALSAGAGGVDSDIQSLTTCFLLAGAPAVIGSLWSVSDESTTKLMVRFYESFLELGTSEALRRAQLELLKDPKSPFAHPLYWAAFGVYGLDK